MLAKLACANLSVKLANVNLLNYRVLVYLSWSWSVVILFPISLIFVLYSVFLTELLTLRILFSTAVRAVVVAKLIILVSWP